MFEDAAARALEELWRMRSTVDLFGSALDMEAQQWKDASGGIGPSSDSFYEYLLKAYILLGTPPPELCPIPPLALISLFRASFCLMPGLVIS